MSDEQIDFSTVTDRTAALLDGVADRQLDRPTPCEAYTVAALVNHLLGLAEAFTAAARKERGPLTDAPPPTPSARVDPRWRELLPPRLAALAAAWNDPAARTGEATAGGVTFDAEAMALVALNEVAIHGWDLAAATGQAFTLPPSVVAVLTGFAEQTAADPASREGLYGPVVAPGPDAAAQDRLIAFTGRDPAWTPRTAD